MTETKVNSSFLSKQKRSALNKSNSLPDLLPEKLRESFRQSGIWISPPQRLMSASVPVPEAMTDEHFQIVQITKLQPVQRLAVNTV